MARHEKNFVEGNDKEVGKGDFANMPQDVKFHAYPKRGLKRNEGIDDSMTNIDEIGENSENKKSRYVSNQK
ncbi:hypothetical protein HC928_02715 [bacterium]|nr:hypothetical protein [bacterium]